MHLLLEVFSEGDSKEKNDEVKVFSLMFDSLCLKALEQHG